MKLQCQQAIGTARLLISVNYLSSFNTVYVLCEIEVSGNNTVTVPFFIFDCLSNVSVLRKFLNALLKFTIFTNLKYGFFSSKREDTSKRFPITDTGISWAGINICLITTNTPLISTILKFKATVLYATVSTDNLII